MRRGRDDHEYLVAIHESTQVIRHDLRCLIAEKMMVGNPHAISPVVNATEAIFDDDYWEQKAKRYEAELTRLRGLMREWERQDSTRDVAYRDDLCERWRAALGEGEVTG
ncbi:MAG: hypothetical protein LC793_13140 [Thermomicrobia bacterium]|nr:hypothetical protein [Thermomicrobia bacterium]MCA1723327.1 hypothetical protein [Thermomicrobia bacterium]